MASKHTSKESISKTSPKTAERIVAISLQHPELGARRLVPVLKKKRISVSVATIQSILRRQGLQNREKRLAEIKKQAQKPKSLPKKSSAKIPDKDTESIVELSLKHPEHGARRLMGELSKKKIVVSESTVYTNLKRHGLQTRDKRLAKIKKRTKKTRKPKTPPKKLATKVTDEVAERICEISLQNPDLGAKRLVRLLKEQDIFASSSAVYRILKRNNLGNREKRLLKLEMLQKPEFPPAPELDGPDPIAEAAKTDPVPSIDKLPEFMAEATGTELTPPVGEEPEPVYEPTVAAPVPPDDGVPTPSEQPETLPEAVLAAPTQPERPPVQKTSKKPIIKRSHWVFYPLYLLLLIVIGYLGFHAIQTIQYAGLETGTLTIAESATEGLTLKTESAISVQPLNDYSRIWERNLFNITKTKNPGLQKKVSLEKIALAKKDLGLELVGTVVADDPKLSRAIIDNRSIRKQEAYREGDSAGKVRIKKILRNNVIITTDKGDELLTVEIKKSDKNASTTQSQNLGSQASAAQQATGTRQQKARTRSIRLKGDEVADSLADIDGLMKQMKITSYKSGDQAAGFRIGIITRDSVLRKMGLRSRDVIVGIDDETITSPDQASDFFQKLAEGGEVTIKLKRRRRTREIKLNIE